MIKVETPSWKEGALERFNWQWRPEERLVLLKFFTFSFTHLHAQVAVPTFPTVSVFVCVCLLTIGIKWDRDNR